MDIRITKTAAPAARPDAGTLGFGKYFTDHMFMMDYDAGQGWHDARIVPFAPLTLTPAAVVFHYGAEVFEGLKAYRTADGNVQLFRPIDNMRRMNDSAERIGLPQFDEQDGMQALLALVDLDRDWVPAADGTSLYLRPFLIATDPSLGIHTIEHALFCIIASPSGSYYKEGINPVRIMIETADVRAVRGGTGYAKCGGNYAASNRAGERAEKKGYSQVLWLDGVERKYIEEVGAMNMFFVIDGAIVTPPLRGSILPGITRDSVIKLGRKMGYDVQERLISIDEVMETARNGHMSEAFGSGTAAVISPVGAFCLEKEEVQVGDGGIGPISQKLYDTLTGIQYGRIPDEMGWSVKLDF